MHETDGQQHHWELNDSLRSGIIAEILTYLLQLLLITETQPVREIKLYETRSSAVDLLCSPSGVTCESVWSWEVSSGSFTSQQDHYFISFVKISQSKES